MKFIYVPKGMKMFKSQGSSVPKVGNYSLNIHLVVKCVHPTGLLYLKLESKYMELGSISIWYSLITTSIVIIFHILLILSVFL